MIYKFKIKKTLSIITMLMILITMPFMISGCNSSDDSSGDEAEIEYAEPSNEPVDPDLSGTSGKYSGFLIDFCADFDATGTYWALCYFAMDVSSLAEKYDVTDEGGAYAGLQNTLDGKMGIMSFWEIHYTDDNGEDAILNAERVYPEGGETDRFGGEGEGTNYIGPYPWEKGKW